MPTILDILFSRRSIRAYQDRAVEPELLTKLLQAAMAAPSAVNAQPWEFIVVTDPDTLAALRSKLLFGRYKVPAAIVVCGSPGTAHNPAGRQFWVQDCSAAIENILIAATGLGLGSVWIGIYPVAPLVRAVSALLNIPDGVTPLGAVYLGYAETPKAPRTRYDERRVHWQLYQPRKRRARLKNTKKDEG